MTSTTATTIFEQTAQVPDWRDDAEYVTTYTRADEAARTFAELKAKESDLWRHATRGHGDLQVLPPPGHPCWTARYDAQMAEEDQRAADAARDAAEDAAKRRAAPLGEAALRHAFEDRVAPALGALILALAEWDVCCVEVERKTGVSMMGLSSSVCLTPGDLSMWLAAARRELGVQR